MQICLDSVYGYFFLFAFDEKLQKNHHLKEEILKMESFEVKKNHLNRKFKKCETRKQIDRQILLSSYDYDSRKNEFSLLRVVRFGSVRFGLTCHYDTPTFEPLARSLP
jgi:hypothetical protein